ncbi:hypothetical protein SH580_21095 [Coraliomargarita algicola]|uniref:Uncharacterized protein n=1 Tax=Coraliomargarita algicola TaxID=3092156 RepID=A0ABZ0RMB9_9BACT|nr:hypothetical protein [Coraliomargarita sp. J2-16]WPJ95915.1 hypothetical protein SH580_21095 [Coraliomargarita sp. J2-16]
MQTKDLRLDKIDIYGGTQARVATNDEAISSYAEAMLEGAQFPPSSPTTTAPSIG